MRPSVFLIFVIGASSVRGCSKQDNPLHALMELPVIGRAIKNAIANSGRMPVDDFVRKMLQNVDVEGIVRDLLSYQNGVEGVFTQGQNPASNQQVQGNFLGGGQGMSVGQETGPGIGQRQEAAQPAAQQVQGNFVEGGQGMGAGQETGLGIGQRQEAAQPAAQGTQMGNSQGSHDSPPFPGWFPGNPDGEDFWPKPEDRTKESFWPGATGVPPSRSPDTRLQAKYRPDIGRAAAPPAGSVTERPRGKLCPTQDQDEPRAPPTSQAPEQQTAPQGEQLELIQNAIIRGLPPWVEKHYSMGENGQDGENGQGGLHRQEAQGEPQEQEGQRGPLGEDEEERLNSQKEQGKRRTLLGEDEEYRLISQNGQGGMHEQGEQGGLNQQNGEEGKGGLPEQEGQGGLNSQNGQGGQKVQGGLNERRGEGEQGGPGIQTGQDGQKDQHGRGMKPKTVGIGRLQAIEMNIFNGHQDSRQPFQSWNAWANSSAWSRTGTLNGNTPSNTMNGDLSLKARGVAPNAGLDSTPNANIGDKVSFPDADSKTSSPPENPSGLNPANGAPNVSGITPPPSTITTPCPCKLRKQKRLL